MVSIITVTDNAARINHSRVLDLDFADWNFGCHDLMRVSSCAISGSWAYGPLGIVVVAPVVTEHLICLLAPLRL